MNLKAFAKKLGITEATASRLRQHDAWPAEVPRRTPPRGYTAAHAALVADWRSRELREDRAADGPADLTNIRQRKDLEAMLLTKVKRELLQGKYVARSLHVAALERLADLFVAALNQLEQAVPLAVPGMTPEQRGEIECVLAQRCADQRDKIAERGRIEVNHAHDAVAETERARRGKGRPVRGSGKVEPTRKRKAKA